MWRTRRYAPSRRGCGTTSRGPTAPFAVSNVRALIQDDWAVPPPPRAPQLLPDSEPSYDGDPPGAGHDEGPPQPPARQARRPASHPPPPRQGGAAANPWAATEPESSGPPLPDHGALDAAFAAAGGSPPSGMQTPTPGAIRAAYVDDTYGEHRPPAVSQRRAGAARWIVGLVVAGMAALTLATVGKRLLGERPGGEGRRGATRASARCSPTARRASPTATSSRPRSSSTRRACSASATPRAVADLARLAAAQAPTCDWLRVRLLPAGRSRRVDGQARARPTPPSARARPRTSAAELAPADPAVVRSRIDALRFAGDLDGARKLVGGISGASAQPDNALALAELDLAESEPDWPTVIGRLRAALGHGRQPRPRPLHAGLRARALAATTPAPATELGASARCPGPHPLVGRAQGLHRPDGERPTPTRSPTLRQAAAGGRAPARPARRPRVSLAAVVDPPRASRRSASTRVPVEPRPAPLPEMPAPPSGPVDTSDLPGVKAPPSPPPTTAAPAPPPVPTSTVPPGVDTSESPGFK